MIPLRLCDLIITFFGFTKRLPTAGVTPLEIATIKGKILEYTWRLKKTEKAICSLVEAGFEYVTEFESAKIFRKRKL